VNRFQDEGETFMNMSSKNLISWAVFLTALTAGLALRFPTPHFYADQIPSGWVASNMKPIGYSDLEGGGAFKMAIRHIGDRWYLYMGHLWKRGWTIVDVTDPANPEVVKFISGPENTWTIQIDLHDKIMVTSVGSFAESWGGDPKKPSEEGVLIWDISSPTSPELYSHWKTGSPAGTHRNSYPGGKYTYLSAAMPGYKSNILVILDISDPKNPKEAGRWWMPGQKDGEQPPLQNVGFHGPAMIDGDRAYLGYGGSVVILDVADKSLPRLTGRLDFAPPFKGGFTGVHDVLPIPGKSALFVHSEGGGGDTPEMAPTCSGPLDLAAMVDIKDPAKPRLMSIFPLPVPPQGEPYSDFCDKGGRFGPHNTNLEQHLPDVEKQGDLIYLTYFNAGLRIFNIKDPRMPKETGWFIPPTPSKRIGPIPAKLVTQTEDVLVDTRGNFYITDKQWGLWVLRYTGPGEPAPTAK
jgi:hypothetical protein